MSQVSIKFKILYHHNNGDNVDKEEYNILVKERSKQPEIFEDALISFLIGGLLGAVYEVLTNVFINTFELSAKIASGWTCLTFILFAVLMTGFGVFDNMVSKFKFGLIIPITGFAHSVASSLLDYRKEGLITGLGSNMFKLAGCVILYGTVAAFIGALIKVIIYG